MRALVLAAATLGVSGCCVVEAMAFPEACVQESTGRCVDLVTDTCADEPSPSSPMCGATLRQATCASLGYTKPCGEYAIRREASCR
jgi:hypothetical protein